MKWVFGALVSLLFLGCEAGESTTKDALGYLSSYDEARAEASASGRPLLINFGGPW